MSSTRAPCSGSRKTEKRARPSPYSRQATVSDDAGLRRWVELERLKPGGNQSERQPLACSAGASEKLTDWQSAPG